MRTGGSYGAMSTPRTMTGSPAPTVSSQSTVMTAQTPLVHAPSWDNNSGVAYGQRNVPGQNILQLPNPFLDPLSRPGTADTAHTALSYNSTIPAFGPRGDMQYGGQDMVFLSPFQLPPLVTDDEKTQRPPVSPGVESIYSLYSSSSPQEEHPEVDLEKARAATMTHAHYVKPNATVRLTLSSPPRTLTATPHSAHSVAPSVDWASEQQHMQMQAGVPAQQYLFMAPMSRISPPSPVHARAASDPVYRPYTASPRMLHPSQQYPPTTYDSTVLLPNPFPMVGATNVKRYASIGHTRAQMSYPGGPGAPSLTRELRNAHLQAAMGRNPPRTQMTYPMVASGGMAGKKTVSRAECRQLVINAAAGR